MTPLQKKKKYFGENFFMKLIILMKNKTMSFFFQSIYDMKSVSRRQVYDKSHYKCLVVYA